MDFFDFLTTLKLSFSSSIVKSFLSEPGTENSTENSVSFSKILCGGTILFETLKKSKIKSSNINLLFVLFIIFIFKFLKLFTITIEQILIPIEIYAIMSYIKIF